MTRTRKQTTTYNGFAIPLQPVTELGLAMLIAGDFEAELTDAAAHAIDGSVVLAGIACVEDQTVDGPACESPLTKVW